MKRIVAPLLLLLAAGCGQKKAEEFTPLPFPQVNVPGIYADDREAAMEYAALHFWDALADTARSFPSDSSLVSGVKADVVEGAYANYAGLLSVLPYDKASAAIGLMLDRALLCEQADSSSNVFETIVGFTEKYLYDPNSPLRNEDLYRPFALKMSGYDGISAEKRNVYAREARMCALNMVDTKAADFTFSDSKGRVRSLYGIKAEYTLLFFSNPGCEACMDIIRMLESSPVVDGLVVSGRLAVVNVYIDEDVASWYDYMPVYPEEWYNGYDHNLIIRNDLLYNVRAIPSVYLLGRDKTVLMKDAIPENVMRFLAGLVE